MSNNNTILLKKIWPYKSKHRDTLSHFGGDPLFPEHWAWPTHTSTWPGHDKTEKKYPMHLYAQVDCGQIPNVIGRELLPERGILYFFIFIEERLGQEEWLGDMPACAVRHYSGSVSDLSRRCPPEDIQRIYPAYRTGAYDESIINEVQTDEYMKRLGFVPMSFHPITTTQDPISNYPGHKLDNIDREDWLCEREQQVNQILGPMDQPVYESVLDDPQWPETVLQARLYLKLEQAGWMKQIGHSEAMLEKINRGMPLHDDLNIREPEDKTERERIRHYSLKALSENTDKHKASIDILNSLEQLQDTSETPNTIRSKIRSLRSETDSKLYHKHITNHLLRVYAVDEVPVSDTSISYAKQTRQKADCNENQILGFPRELQSGSPASALRGLKKLGWVDESATENDISLLAQFDTCFGGIDIHWGNSGMVYFYGLTKDFRNKNYDRVIVVLEGC